MSAYATAAEVTARLALILPSTDERRVLFEAASTGDQSVFVRRASDDVDRLRYIGETLSEGQGRSWPRRRLADGSLIDTDPDEPAGATVTALPAAVRDAHAIQSAALAVRAAGYGNAGRLAAEAHRGVASAGSSGRTESIDLRRANAPAAALDHEAYALLRRYVSAGGDFL